MQVEKKLNVPTIRDEKIPEIKNVGAFVEAVIHNLKEVQPVPNLPKK